MTWRVGGPDNKSMGPQAWIWNGLDSVRSDREVRIACYCSELWKSSDSVGFFPHALLLDSPFLVGGEDV